MIWEEVPARDRKAMMTTAMAKITTSTGTLISTIRQATIAMDMAMTGTTIEVHDTSVLVFSAVNG